MNCLLDTHTLLWYLQNSENLSDRTTEILEDANNNLSVSIASLWEISIKLGLGKLRLQKSFSELEEVLQQLILMPIPFTESGDKLAGCESVAVLEKL
ncbi:type II toxin-antitoxin system VapC family toxin [Phormidium pseudopriestleyi]|uniref:type II toxin-antitoxin system VapC family toxin n=1 Tax=Phormidium pseudopriestleyi TaxID=1759527 RepID=UPI001F5CF42D|nr:type II toxin-antitoxin system VapC family toxin [Phormidium pseudopriestleyi]